MPVPTSEQLVPETAASCDVSELNRRMTNMPRQMRAFSLGLRSLYAENAVSGDQGAAKFREVRDATRRDALVYCAKVLPLANMVVTNISEYFDNYLALEWEEWVASIGDIIEEVEGYERACALLLQMHENIMTSLKQRQDEAAVSIVELERLSAELRGRIRELEAEATASDETARFWSAWGRLLALPTLGLSSFICENGAEGHRANANRCLSTAVAETRKKEIATRAALITNDVLLPAIKEFLEGLSVCQAFFAETRGELVKMQGQAELAADKTDTSRTVRHFRLMKKNAGDIAANCKAFWSCIAEVRTDLAAIPTEKLDENYVDAWQDRQMVEYERSAGRGTAKKMFLAIEQGLRRIGMGQTATTAAPKTLS